MKPLSERIAEMYPGDNEEGPWLPPTMTAEVAALEARIEALEKADRISMDNIIEKAARIEVLEMTLAFYGRCGHLGFDGGARARAALRGEEER